MIAVDSVQQFLDSVERGREAYKDVTREPRQALIRFLLDGIAELQKDGVICYLGANVNDSNPEGWGWSYEIVDGVLHRKHNVGRKTERIYTACEIGDIPFDKFSDRELVYMGRNVRDVRQGIKPSYMQGGNHYKKKRA